MIYTIGEMAKKMNIAPSALRYYDKEGLMPFVERSESGIRIFTENDFEGLSIIHCLKQAGLPIKDIKKFIDMVAKGDETIDERLELFRSKREDVKRQIQELQKTLQVLEYKCWYYETSKQAGTTSYIENMKLDDMPAEYAKTREHLNSL